MYQAYRLLLLPLLLLFLCTVTEAQTDRDTLKGHQSIGVLVENLRSEIENSGVTREQLQSDVELALRKAGIKVDDGASSYLYVNINMIRAKTTQGVEIGLAYSIELDFKQPATLSVSKTLAIVTTWTKGTVGVTGRDDSRSVRTGLNDYVSRFINDFLAANQK